MKLTEAEQAVLAALESRPLITSRIANRTGYGAYYVLEVLAKLSKRGLVLKVKKPLKRAMWKRVRKITGE